MLGDRVLPVRGYRGGEQCQELQPPAQHVHRGQAAPPDQ